MSGVRVIAVFQALALTAACSPASVSGTLTVHAARETPQDLTNGAEVLAARLREFLPSFRSTVTSSVEGSVIRLTFRGEAPSEQEIRYLATTRGELCIGPADEPSTVWVSDRDIEDVTLVKTDSGPFLDLRLKEQPARTLSELTSRNVGRSLLVTWEGRPILSAPIRGAFGQTFQFNAPSVQEGQMIRTILKGGRLPISADSVEYVHGT